jgi:SAM-dependent methyltransferase
MDGAGFRFPYDDGSFDLVVGKSVWTHLLREEASAYLAECARVLRVGGRCWISFFLLNDESRRLVDEDRASMRFPFERDEVHRVNVQESPEAAVAYDERFVVASFQRNGLKPQVPIDYGTWSGRTDGSDYQDVVLATKT